MPSVDTALWPASRSQRRVGKEWLAVKLGLGSKCSLYLGERLPAPYPIHFDLSLYPIAGTKCKLHKILFVLLSAGHYDVVDLSWGNTQVVVAT